MTVIVKIIEANNYTYEHNSEVNADCLGLDSLGNVFMFLKEGETIYEYCAPCGDTVARPVVVKQLKVRKAPIVTHVPLFKEQMVRHRSDNPHADAYFGNFTMGKELLKFSKVTDVISGHTHRKVDEMVGNIRVQVVPSDYFKPAFVTLEF